MPLLREMQPLATVSAADELPELSRFPADHPIAPGMWPDPLEAIKGIALGIVLGCTMWALVILLLARYL